MTAANIPNDIQNLQPADAVPVNQNFQYLQTFLNSEVINRDGSTAMTGPLTLKENPTQPLQAATKAYVDSFFPVGTVMLFGGEAAPSGDWLLCRGQTLATGDYPALFAVLGYRYGGSGGNFRLPDLRHRFPIGVDTGETDINTTGKTGGSATVPVAAHTHTMAHTHSISHTHSINHDHPATNTGSNSASHSHTFSGTTSAGGVHTHNVSNQLVAQFGGGNLGLPIGGYGQPLNLGNPISNSSSHAHTFSGTTSSQSANHYHSVNIPNFVGTSGGASTSTSGAASTSTTSSTGDSNPKLRPEYVALNYIIRTK